MNEIKRTQQRALSYRYRDGINEVVVGIALVLAGLIWLWASGNESHLVRYIALFSSFSTIPLALLASRILKNRITFPRSGIVHYPRPEKWQFRRSLWINGLCFLLINSTRHIWDGMYLWGLPLSDLVMAGLLVPLVLLFAVKARHWHMPRLFVIAAAILSVAVLFLYANGSDLVKLSLVFLIPGIAAILTGGFAFASYLKRYPRNAEETL